MRTCLLTNQGREAAPVGRIVNRVWGGVIWQMTAPPGEWLRARGERYDSAVVAI